jgi:cytochrome bd-type quinol oxidase subunit 2
MLPFLACIMERAMNSHSVNRICAAVPLILSLMACVWVLGNVAGGIRSANSDEGLGFKVFWLLITAQIPFIAGYLVTADWKKRQGSAAARLVLQGAALVLAFSPVAYFKL